MAKWVVNAQKMSYLSITHIQIKTMKLKTTFPHAFSLITLLLMLFFCTAYSSDASARSVSLLRALAIDTVPPVITINGPDTMLVCLDSMYIDPGATAFDNFDGNITSRMVVTSNVNTSIAGVYFVNYNVIDSTGNEADTAHRVVVVYDCNSGDTLPPVITLIGGDTLIICRDSAFIDPGATVTDNMNPGLQFMVTGTVNTSIIGTYILHYNAADSSGNVATTKHRVVIVINCHTGIKRTPQEKGQLNVFPNPGNGSFQLSMPSLEKVDQISVYNTLGEKMEVTITTISEGYFLLEMDKAAAGVYYIRVMSGNQLNTKKITVIK